MFLLPFFLAFPLFLPSFVFLFCIFLHFGLTEAVVVVVKARKADVHNCILA